MAEFIDLTGCTVFGGWTIERYLSSGSFGHIYLVKHEDGKSGIIKVQVAGYETIRYEATVLKRIEDLNGFPKVYSTGSVQGNSMIVMQRLGRSLESLMKSYVFTITDILKLGIQMVARLRDLHGEGLLHRDIHTGNIMTGHESDGESGTMYLIDFGESGIIDGSRPSRLHGSMLFAPFVAHRRRKYGRKDDLESLVYVLAYSFSNILPWRFYLSYNYTQSKLERKIMKMKYSLRASEICYGLPSSIKNILKDVRYLRRKDVPDYECYIRMMRDSLHSTGASQSDKFSWE